MYDFLKDVIKAFQNKDDEFFHSKDIDVLTKGQFSILNYHQDADRNGHNSWCRALVLDQTGRVRSLPFARFFNRGEKDALDLPLKKCDFIEKLDGCLIGAFFDDNKNLVLHSRRMVSSHKPDLDMEITSFTGKRVSLLKLAHKYLENVQWQGDDYDCCFAFELVHDCTHVVTEYPEDRWGMYLIGGRDLSTWEEMCEGELTGMAEEMNSHPGVNILRPYIYHFEDENDLQETLLGMPDDFEGFVAREWFTTDRRYKLKKPSYLERHHMIDRKRSVRSCLPIWLKGEQQEILAYFPDAKGKFDALDKAYAEFLVMVRDKVLYWQYAVKELGMGKKELAAFLMADEPRWVHTFIFSLYDKPWDDANLWQMLVNRLPDVRAVESLLFGDDNGCHLV